MRLSQEAATGAAPHAAVWSAAACPPPGPSPSTAGCHGGGTQHHGMRHPSGQNQHHAGRPRNISSSSSVGGHAGVDLAALAAMMGAGTAQVGRAAPPVTAINLEDLGMFDGQSLARLLF